jgi:beta-glucosidase
MSARPAHHTLRLRGAACAVAAVVATGAGPAIGSPAWSPAAAAVTATARPWMSPGQTSQQRAGELLARMSLDEKIVMVHGDAFPTGGTYAGHIPANTRLGIPALVLSDGPNGVGNGSTGVTAFPVAVTDAAAFDRSLADKYGAALGAEQAGKGHNIALAPTINILRTPLWGRESETYTEDPYLNGQTAAAEVRGIQGNHVIATPKHFVANNQETGRFSSATAASVDEKVSQRALQEIYYPGFKAAVQQGRAGAVMCSYNQINGAYGCENPQTLSTLEKQWGWNGFVMSDWFATHSTVVAANAGLDMEMPTGVNFGAALKQAVLSGAVSMATLNEMVRRILTSMFAIGLFDHPLSGDDSSVVSTSAHQRLAQQITEQGSVLLKNADGVLPLDKNVKKIAVVGADASTDPQVSEGGSGAVLPTGAVVTGLQGIRARAGKNVEVTYSPGTLGTAPLPVLTGDVLTPSSGTGSGLTGTYFASPDFTGAPVATRTDASVDVSSTPVAGLPRVWSARWTGTLTPHSTGDYRFSLNVAGQAQLRVGGKRLINVKYADFATTAHGLVHLRAGHRVPIELDYTSNRALIGGAVHLGWAPPDRLQHDAVQAARAADVAVVFVNDSTGEGSDRTGLGLPGDQDQLISAVAKANRHTVVVLNTGGPVLMPWLSKVAGVVESWYPGQEGGSAEAALLFGDVNPSGRLPMTFPANERQGPASSPADLHVDTERYDEGLLVGYRWFDATHTRPLFPFGYGLSYTKFRYSHLAVTRSGASTTVRVRVTNTGSRTGSDVVQLYVNAPAAAHEPPKQLKDYGKVTLRPGGSRTVTFRLGRDAFASWNGHWVVHPGRYRILVGSSARDVALSKTVFVAR